MRWHPAKVERILEGAYDPTPYSTHRFGFAYADTGGSDLVSFYYMRFELPSDLMCEGKVRHSYKIEIRKRNS